MIHVDKPAAPAVLLTRGVAAAQVHCDEHDASPDEYRGGTVKFDFDATIYAAPEVKDALRTAQHRKCAFCESSFDHVAYGDVEHFRPKGAYKQRKGDAKKYPGYYWLAYEWSNLFCSCQLCNQRFKENVFPLADGRRRAHPRTRDTANEKALLIDPAVLNPSGYIGFHAEYAFAVGGCPEGEATIEVLGLNREELAENRRKRLQDLEALQQLCVRLRAALAENATPQLVAELQRWEERLQEKQQDAAEYAAMARAFLASP